MTSELHMTAPNKNVGSWYDSTVTTHVCCDKTLLKNTEDGDEKLLMGNNDTVEVNGKGTVKLQFTFGKKLILMNVVHVLDIKESHISKYFM